MKLRKLMLCLLASLLVAGVHGTHADAAEVTEKTRITVTATQGLAVTTEESETDLIEETNEEVTEKEEELEIELKNTETSESAKKVTTKSTTKNITEEKAYTKSELRLLSALIYCEANAEPYAGKLAVGIVVVNRMESKLFPNSIKNVIYQRCQFGPARNGTLKKALKEYDNGKFTSADEKACIKAAKEALSGVKKVTYRDKKINMKSYLYFSGWVKNARLTIANHQFK